MDVFTKENLMKCTKTEKIGLNVEKRVKKNVKTFKMKTNDKHALTSGGQSWCL